MSNPGAASAVAGEAREAAVVAGLVNHTIFAEDQPVRGVRKYRRDWVVEKKPTTQYLERVRTERGAIMKFSNRSRYRLLHLAKNCNVDFRSMLTITYPADFSSNGREVKRHLKNFKDWLGDEVEDVAGIWFLEFQKRGAPHFHFLLNVNLGDGDLVLKRRTGVRRGEKSDSYYTCQVCQDRASAAWYRIVGSGDERHLRAGVCWEVLESEEAALRYAAKHAAKPKQKTVPEGFQDVGRFWGKIGDVRLVGGEELEEMNAAEIFGRFGLKALSSSGRVRKYLWDAPIEDA